MSFCDVFDVTDFVGLMKTPMNPICVFTMRDLSCNHLFQKYYGALVLQNIDWPLTTSKMANMEHLMHYVCCILPNTYMLLSQVFMLVLPNSDHSSVRLFWPLLGCHGVCSGPAIIQAPPLAAQALPVAAVQVCHCHACHACHCCVAAAGMQIGRNGGGTTIGTCALAED